MKLSELENCIAVIKQISLFLEINIEIVKDKRI